MKDTVKRMKKTCYTLGKKYFQITYLIKDIDFVYIRSLKLNNPIKSGQRSEQTPHQIIYEWQANIDS